VPDLGRQRSTRSFRKGATDDRRSRPPTPRAFRHRRGRSLRRDPAAARSCRADPRRYTEGNVDRQRGRGTFDGSIAALRRLNELGYGRAGSDLRLDIVYNPLGASLPPAQRELEHDDERELGDRFPDPSRLFNSSLEGNTRRAIDIHEGAKVDAGAFKALVKAAVAQNGPPAKKR
jgi:hypothetical protein